MDEKYMNQIFKNDFNLYYKLNYCKSFRTFNFNTPKTSQAIYIHFNKNIISYTFFLINKFISFKNKFISPTNKLIYNINKWSYINIVYEPNYISIIKKNNTNLYIEKNINYYRLKYIDLSNNRYIKTFEDNKIIDTIFKYSFNCQIKFNIIKYNYTNNYIYLSNKTTIHQLYHTFINNYKLTI